MRAVLKWAMPDRSPAGGGSVPSRSSRPGNGHKRPSTVLIVEDEFLVRMSVADFLRDSGYRVLEASNAAEAKAVFHTGEPIELLFSDITMPGEMDGRGLAKWVQAEYPDVRIILTSGAVDLREAAGPGLFLRKPYGFEDLAAAIRKLLES